MKLYTPILVMFLLSLFPAQAIAVEEPVLKTFCQLALGYESVDQLKQNLLVSVKRDAVNELFGELLTAATAVEDAIVTSDQIRTSSIGFVRVEDTPSFYNGDSLAEVCVTIKGYATAEDRQQFVPIQLDKRHCVTDATLTTSEIKEFARQEVIVQALLDYEPKLKDKARSELLKLIQRIAYLESDFVTDTETYCVQATGFILPIEVVAYIESNDLTVTDGIDGNNIPTNDNSESTGETASSSITLHECSTSVEFGQFMNCKVEKSGQKNTHKFSANEGDRIIITMSRTEGELEPNFVVYDSRGTTVCYYTAPGRKVVEETCTISTEGSYTITAYSAYADRLGSYNLNVQRLNNPSGATSIEYGKIVDSTIDVIAEYDYYTFQANEGDIVTVTMARTGGEIEPNFLVYGIRGTTVCYYTAPGRKVVEETCKIPTTGSYTIVAYSAYPDKLGSYSLGTTN